ncbi:phage tail assembly protein [Shewanella dokdonensis]|uniref:Phage tail assembly protein n=1 Tax=Shewanella dokdonensis TaxID=712036 RepID=A0ABX8DEU9_9GAMM|nr:phage tail assembly protein [Shewanella dokdonensis]MCL1075979.1 phage tail assembly protein [Shewanella dokdonensis]QVK23264.1 phage tail assembly protein [Shewanella dokdonensis]
MSTETVTLDNPIQRGDTQITDITLRKPKAGELRGLNLNDILNMDVNSLTVLLPRISSPMLTKDEARQLEPEDLLLLGGAVANFLLPKQLREPSSPDA